MTFALISVAIASCPCADASDATPSRWLMGQEEETMSGKWLIAPLTLLLLATAWLDSKVGGRVVFDEPNAAPHVLQRNAAGMY